MKKQIIRFAVGSPEHTQSSVWRFWVNGDDVYLGAKNLLQTFKVSLHKSGIWRIAFVAELEQEDSDKDRVIVKWKRPPARHDGWTHSVAILVSSILPVDLFNDVKVVDTRIKWFSAPVFGKKFIFEVMFSPIEVTEDDWNQLSNIGDQLVCVFSMSNENVWLILRENELADAEEYKIRDVMAKTKIHLKREAKSDLVFSSRVILIEDTPTILTQPTLIDIPLGKENLTYDSIIDS